MKLTKFKDPLPIPPLLKPKWRTDQLTYYEVTMIEALQSLHSDISKAKIWGFEGMYPGPTIEVNARERVYVKWMNQLPDQHLFPIDHTVHGASKKVPDVRTVVHLHGGRSEPLVMAIRMPGLRRALYKKGLFSKKRTTNI